MVITLTIIVSLNFHLPKLKLYSPLNSNFTSPPNSPHPQASTNVFSDSLNLAILRILYPYTTFTK